MFTFYELVQEFLMEWVRTKEDAKKVEEKFCKRCYRDCDHCELDNMIQFHIDCVAPSLAKI